MSKPTTHPEPRVPAPGGCEEALRQILQSRTFARAEKLQRFLKFVSELTLAGEATLVNEHLIAVDVFGRGDDYSPGEDSVVRRQAHALRRKLKEYYETEGQADTVRIEIPIGTYVPLFREHAPKSSEPPAAPPRLRRFRLPKTLVLGAVAFSLALTIFWAGWILGRSAYGGRATSPSTDEGVREIWGPWLTDKSGAMFCFSNPLSASLRVFPGPIRPNPEHQGIPVSPSQDAAFRQFFHLPHDGVIYLYPVMVQAKMGEAIAAVTLTGFFSREGVPVSSTESRFVTWATLRKENVILLGHADSNQWIEPMLRNAPFTLAPTSQEHRARVLNQHPQQGEQASYYPTIPDASRSYSLVSMLPGVDGSHKILVISGLDNSSTAAAADYLIAKSGVDTLLRMLHKTSPGHRGPWHFQAILETDVRDSVALKAVPIAVRVL